MPPQQHDSAPRPVLDADGKEADTGPVLEVGDSSIEAERAGTDAESPKRGAPPETELPPD